MFDQIFPIFLTLETLVTLPRDPTRFKEDPMKVTYKFQPPRKPYKG